MKYTIKAMETRNDLEAYCIMNGTQINTDGFVFKKSV